MQVEVVHSIRHRGDLKEGVLRLRGASNANQLESRRSATVACAARLAIQLQVLIRVVAATRIVRFILLHLLRKIVSLKLNSHFIAMRSLLLNNDRNEVARLGKLLKQLRLLQQVLDGVGDLLLLNVLLLAVVFTEEITFVLLFSGRLKLCGHREVLFAWLRIDRQVVLRLGRS